MSNKEIEKVRVGEIDPHDDILTLQSAVNEVIDRVNELSENRADDEKPPERVYVSKCCGADFGFDGEEATAHKVCYGCNSPCKVVRENQNTDTAECNECGAEYDTSGAVSFVNSCCPEGIKDTAECEHDWKYDEANGFITRRCDKCSNAESLEVEQTPTRQEIAERLREIAKEVENNHVTTLWTANELETLADEISDE